MKKSSDKTETRMHEIREILECHREIFTKRLFSSSFPIRMMVCWHDAVDLLLDTMAWLEEHWQELVPDAMSDILMAMLLVVSKVSCQRLQCQEWEHDENETVDEGKLIDKLVASIAIDLSYICETRVKYGITTDDDELTGFQSFLIENFRRGKKDERDKIGSRYFRGALFPNIK